MQKNTNFFIKNKEIAKKLTENNIGMYLVAAEEIYRGFFDFYQFDQQIYKSKEPMFTDQEFDELKEKYKDKFDEAYKSIQPSQKRILYKHPVKCGTLQKFTQKNLEQMQNKIKKIDSKDWIITHKYDGTSCRIYVNRYNNNISITAISRGDSKNTDLGLDITNKIQDQIAPFKNILKWMIFQFNLSQIIMRGELIFPKSQGEDADTLRSKVNGESVSQNKMTCDIVLYEFLQKDLNNNFIPSDYQFQLDILNIITNQNIPYQIVNQKFIQPEMFQLFKQNNQINYSTDGIVLKANDIFEIPETEKPKYQFAYKFESAVYESIITKLEWLPRLILQQDSEINYSLQAKIHYNEIKINSKKNSQCKGFSPEWIIVNNLLPGKNIQIINSGQVIPNCKYIYDPSESHKVFIDNKYSQKLLEQIKPKQCFCGGEVDISNDNQFYCVSGNCQYYQLIKKIKDIFNIQGIGDVEMKKIFDQICKSKYPNYVFQDWFLNLIQERQEKLNLTKMCAIFVKGFSIKKAQLKISQNKENVQNTLKRILQYKKFNKLIQFISIDSSD